MAKSKKRKKLVVDNALIVAVLTVLAALIPVIYGRLKNGATISQNITGSDNTIMSTHGDKSPAINISHSVLNVNLPLNVESRTHELRNFNMDFNGLLYAAIQSEDFLNDNEQMIKYQPVNHHATYVATPKRVLDLRKNLTSSYMANDVDEAVASAREGTNLFWGIINAYSNETINVSSEFIKIEADFYGVLAEYALSIKDYQSSLQLIVKSQRIEQTTNVLSIAIELALYVLLDEDDKISSYLTHIRNNFPQGTRYDVLNTLSKMGYLLPYRITKNVEKNQWEVTDDAEFEKKFGLEKKLEWPSVFRVRAGDADSNPTVVRWVGFNKYEPLDLHHHFQKVIAKLERSEMAQ